MTAVRALVLEAPRRLEVHEFAVPRTADDDAVLRIEACGLCGTDHEQFTGELHPGVPFIPGHEAVGVIEDIGPTASSRWGVRTGDRVAVEVFQACGTCVECRGGNASRCEQHGLVDMYGFVPVDRPPSLWGGYAEMQYLAPDSRVVRVPDGLDPVIATLSNPVGAGIRWAATLPGTTSGDVVAILGPGIRGLASAAAAKEAGASFVMVTGIGERDAQRLSIAGDFGADLAVDISTTDAVSALRDATGGLADIVVDVTAKAPAALGQAMALARSGGTVVLAGTRASDVTPGFHPDAIVTKELRILGALGVDSAAYRQALELLSSGRYPFASLPRRVAGFADVGELLVDMAGEGAVPPVHGVVTPS